MTVKEVDPLTAAIEDAINKIEGICELYDVSIDCDGDGLCGDLVCNAVGCVADCLARLKNARVVAKARGEQP